MQFLKVVGVLRGLQLLLDLPVDFGMQFKVVEGCRLIRVGMGMKDVDFPLDLLVQFDVSHSFCDRLLGGLDDFEVEVVLQIAHGGSASHDVGEVSGTSFGGVRLCFFLVDIQTDCYWFGRKRLLVLLKCIFFDVSDGWLGSALDAAVDCFGVVSLLQQTLPLNFPSVLHLHGWEYNLPARDGFALLALGITFLLFHQLLLHSLLCWFLNVLIEGGWIVVGDNFLHVLCEFDEGELLGEVGLVAGDQV